MKLIDNANWFILSGPKECKTDSRKAKKNLKQWKGHELGMVPGLINPWRNVGCNQIKERDLFCCFDEETNGYTAFWFVVWKSPNSQPLQWIMYDSWKRIESRDMRDGVI